MLKSYTMTITCRDDLGRTRFKFSKPIGIAIHIVRNSCYLRDSYGDY